MFMESDTLVGTSQYMICMTFSLSGMENTVFLKSELKSSDFFHNPLSETCPWAEWAYRTLPTHFA